MDCETTRRVWTAEGPYLGNDPPTPSANTVETTVHADKSPSKSETPRTRKRDVMNGRIESSFRAARPGIAS